MNFSGKMLVAGVCASILASAGAEIIPGADIAVPAGCSKVSSTEYIVRVAKRTPMPNTTVGLYFYPDITKVAGKVVSFSADLRCANIASDAKGDHVGGKILVSYKDPHGRLRFFGSKVITGTVADWQKHSVKLEIPDGASNLTVAFGIQQGWGTMDVRNPEMNIVTVGIPADASETAIPLSAHSLGYHCKINGDVLTVTVHKQLPMPNTTPGSTVDLDLTNLIGKNIRISGQCRYSVDSNVKGEHVGAKVLVASYQKDDSGRAAWFGSKPFVGKSKEWRDFSVTFPVYDSTAAVRLIFGIQQAWGKAEFRNIVIKALE